MGVSTAMGVPQVRWMVFVRDNPSINGWWFGGFSHFRKPSKKKPWIWGNTVMGQGSSYGLENATFSGTIQPAMTWDIHMGCTLWADASLARTTRWDATPYDGGDEIVLWYPLMLCMSINYICICKNKLSMLVLDWISSKTWDDTILMVYGCLWWIVENSS